METTTVIWIWSCKEHNPFSPQASSPSAVICTVARKEVSWFQPGLSEVAKEYLKGTDTNYSGNRKEENKKKSGKQGKCQLSRLT